MKYIIVENGIISNIIEADADFAAQIGAMPYYGGAAIGGPYDPPEPSELPTGIQLLERRLTDLRLEAIAQGQKQTALELALIEQGQYTTKKELEGLQNV